MTKKKVEINTETKVKRKNMLIITINKKFLAPPRGRSPLFQKGGNNKQ